MKNFSKTYILALSIILLSFSAGAQSYNTAIGVRLGGLTKGLTVKHFTNSTTAIEGILGLGYKSFHITGLLEKHVPIASAPGLKWFYGAGAHVGFFNYGGRYYVIKNNKTYVVREGDNTTLVGVDVILGLDYKFAGAPFNIGLDVKPFVDFYDGTTVLLDAALSLRFAF